MLAKAKSTEDSREREFLFTDRDFKMIVSLVHERAGIALTEQKRELVYSRLSRRLRILKLKKFSDYLRLVDGDKSTDEMGNFINAITTNLTSFFRESHHFDHLAKSVVTPLANSAHAGRKELLVWSAGCSTGEEPYSIAMTIANGLPDWKNHNVRILATDLDTNAVAACRRATYRHESIKQIPRDMTKQFLINDSDETVRIDPDLQRMLSFKQLNLRGTWPMQRQYDVIFCRNVMIYFDDAFKTDLLKGFHSLLKPGGYLYIGHSESAGKLHGGFDLIGRTIYERRA
ncbi:MAG: protein-glutamate O-methyltransferase [Minwuia sp.]|nr:protein-glutamate O-methyltransferase [Minwuia sp.]